MGRSGKYYFNKDLQYKSHEVAQKKQNQIRLVDLASPLY